MSTADSRRKTKRVNQYLFVDALMKIGKMSKKVGGSVSHHIRVAMDEYIERKEKEAHKK